MISFLENKLVFLVGIIIFGLAPFFWFPDGGYILGGDPTFLEFLYPKEFAGHLLGPGNSSLDTIVSDSYRGYYILVLCLNVIFGPYSYAAYWGIYCSLWFSSVFLFLNLISKQFLFDENYQFKVGVALLTFTLAFIATTHPLINFHIYHNRLPIMYSMALYLLTVTQLCSANFVKPSGIIKVVLIIILLNFSPVVASLQWLLPFIFSVSILLLLAFSISNQHRLVLLKLATLYLFCIIFQGIYIHNAGVAVNQAHVDVIEAARVFYEETKNNSLIKALFMVNYSNTVEYNSRAYLIVSFAFYVSSVYLIFNGLKKYKHHTVSKNIRKKFKVLFYSIALFVIICFVLTLPFDRPLSIFILESLFSFLPQLSAFRHINDKLAYTFVLVSLTLAFESIMLAFLVWYRNKAQSFYE